MDNTYRLHPQMELDGALFLATFGSGELWLSPVKGLSTGEVELEIRVCSTPADIPPGPPGPRSASSASLVLTRREMQRVLREMADRLD